MYKMAKTPRAKKTTWQLQKHPFSSELKLQKLQVS